MQLAGAAELQGGPWRQPAPCTPCPFSQCEIADLNPSSYATESPKALPGPNILLPLGAPVIVSGQEVHGCCKTVYTLQ